MTTDTKQSIYCWDTTVFQAWFAEEADKPLGDIALVIREIESKPPRASLLLSVTTYEEILDIDGNEEPTRKFRAYLSHSNVEMANVDPRIADEAARLRSECKRSGRKCPKVPDAQIVATAIVYQADVLHTFDEGMLTYDREAIVGGLRICKPLPLSGHRALPTIANEVNRDGATVNPYLRRLLFRVDQGDWGPPSSHFTRQRTLAHA
ncbi:MAG: PIN domain-containing protein [Planctomycetaceae bacterium]|nr:PIN domain-containing protein [Planctomycetaceae bacterium]